MLLPTACPVCETPGPAPCDRCAQALRRAPNLPPPVAVDGCRALLSYEGEGRELVARLKYRNGRAAIPWLADRMASIAAGLPAAAVTWAPTTADRRRQRGFDHAELLARAVARRLGTPCVPLLRRRPGPAQTGRSAAERRAGGPSFTARRRLSGAVIVVDDVVTTGTTATAAAQALRAAGASPVGFLAAARTPPR